MQRQEENRDNLPQIRFHRLKLLCEMQWVERHTTLDDFIILYEAVRLPGIYQCNKRQLEFEVCNGSKWAAGLVVVIFLHHRVHMHLVFVRLHKDDDYQAVLKLERHKVRFQSPQSSSTTEMLWH